MWPSALSKKVCHNHSKAKGKLPLLPHTPRHVPNPFRSSLCGHCDRQKVAPSLLRLDVVHHLRAAALVEKVIVTAKAARAVETERGVLDMLSILVASVILASVLAVRALALASCHGLALGIGESPGGLAVSTMRIVRKSCRAKNSRNILLERVSLASSGGEEALSPGVG